LTSFAPLHPTVGNACAAHMTSELKPWGAQEKLAWRESRVVQRSYLEKVVSEIDTFREDFDVLQYGALSFDVDKYPLFAVKSRGWEKSKPTVLVTGGVHGYETSGVHGALGFLRVAGKYTERFNIVVAPCVCPWGYETIQRWNREAADPNRSFGATPKEGPVEDTQALQRFLSTLEVDRWICHVDLHETTDTDETEFQPAKSARDGVPHEGGTIPDGFYLVGDSEDPKDAWHKAIIDEVRKVTHIAPADEKGNLIGMSLTQEGVVTAPGSSLGLCMRVTNAEYVTTTEVYPDSPKATDEQCIAAQVAAVTGALEFIMSTDA